VVEQQWDFFISYTAVDVRWAEWVAWELENLGYHALIQAWDFVPGSHWTKSMSDGIERADRTLAILSEAYLASVYGQTEWQAAYRADPQGFRRRLVPVRVEDCRRPGILGEIVSFDLFACSPEEASTRLRTQITAVVGGRAKPSVRPDFPDDSIRARTAPRRDAMPPKGARARFEQRSAELPELPRVTPGPSAATYGRESTTHSRTPSRAARPPILKTRASLLPILYFVPFLLGACALAITIPADHFSVLNSDGTVTFFGPGNALTDAFTIAGFAAVLIRLACTHFRVVYDLVIDDSVLAARRRRRSDSHIWAIPWSHLDRVEVEHFALTSKIWIYAVDGIIAAPFTAGSPARVTAVQALPRFGPWRGRRLEEALRARTTVVPRTATERRS
jgi:hypothetical protein